MTASHHFFRLATAAACLASSLSGISVAADPVIHEAHDVRTVDRPASEPGPSYGEELPRSLAVEMDDTEFSLADFQPEAAAAPARPAPSALALATARRRRSTYRLPSMFGDFFAVGSLQGLLPRIDQSPLLLDVPAGGAAIGRTKISENNSPIPRDRIFFNYNFYNDVRGGVGDVNRYEVGYEHTFWEESSSIEFGIPFASTLDANQFSNGMRATDTRFGDLNVSLKTILVEGEDCLITGGFGLSFPTSGDTRILDNDGQPVVVLENESVHILPYLAAIHSYDSGWYWQGFVQIDVDAGGTPVAADPFGFDLQPIGTLQDQTLLFVDVGVGYWLREPGLGSCAVAATAELHYATTLQDADLVSDIGLFEITSDINRFDILNLTCGVNILVNEAVSVRPGMVIPIAGGDDDQFDFEAMVQMNFWR